MFNLSSDTVKSIWGNKNKQHPFLSKNKFNDLSSDKWRQNNIRVKVPHQLLFLGGRTLIDTTCASLQVIWSAELWCVWNLLPLGKEPWNNHESLIEQIAMWLYPTPPLYSPDKREDRSCQWNLCSVSMGKERPDIPERMRDDWIGLSLTLHALPCQ